jgi:hypothetical protein
VQYVIDSGGILRAQEDGTDIQAIFGCVFCSLGPLAIDGDHCYFGFHDTESSIMRMGLDGTNPEPVALLGDVYFTGLAVDAANGWVYWSSPSAIGRANLDGTGIATLLSGLSGAEGLSIDPVGGKMYWTEEPGRLRRANPDGTAVEDLVVGTGSFAETALHPPSGKVFWLAESPAAALWRANLDGSDPESLPVVLADPTGLAVETDTERIYATDIDDVGVWPPAGRILRCDLDGADAVEVLWAMPAVPSEIALGGLFQDVPAATPIGIAVAVVVVLGISTVIVIRRMRRSGSR